MTSDYRDDRLLLVVGFRDFVLAALLELRADFIFRAARPVREAGVLPPVFLVLAPDEAAFLVAASRACLAWALR